MRKKPPDFLIVGLLADSAKDLKSAARTNLAKFCLLKGVRFFGGIQSSSQSVDQSVSHAISATKPKTIDHCPSGGVLGLAAAIPTLTD